MLEMQNSYMLKGDCLKLMRDIADKSIDMILCDLPYGTTACKWDTVIPFEPLWEQYKRIIKDNGVIALFGAEPFSSGLRVSTIKDYKYDWIWKKKRPSNPQLAKVTPLKSHEDICIFYTKSKRYNPQGLIEIPLNKQKLHKPEPNTLENCVRKEYVQTHTNYPDSILNFDSERGLHPTQKPVALFEYLIKTYTDQGDLVLDNCSGSGTTAIACINTNRNYICMEQDQTYFDKSVERINNHVKPISNEVTSPVLHDFVYSEPLGGELP